MRIYFDNAATTAVSPSVLAAMLPYFGEVFGNPSSIHAEGRRARTAVEHARKTVAQHLNASIGEVFFTSGGSEGNNMAIKCAVRDLGWSATSRLHSYGRPRLLPSRPPGSAWKGNRPYPLTRSLHGHLSSPARSWR